MLNERKNIASNITNNKIGNNLRYEDYSEILSTYGLEYTPSGYYWQIGEIRKVQGWILHLSVIRLQLADLLHNLIPKLVAEKIAFKVPRNSSMAGTLLEGGFGYIRLGKMVSIYPEDDEQTISICQKLIVWTQPFKGPEIPTDIHLGSIVYTRYGAFNPVIIKDAKGEAHEWIYNKDGELIPDPYTVPFVLPTGLIWPFYGIAEPISPKPIKLLNYAYYPIILLKSDVKGFVAKALYFERFWRIRACLVKQGKQNMFDDNEGRDIRDRLKWQYQIYQDLAGTIRMPQIFDHFTQKKDSYLAMQFIKGDSLLSRFEKVCSGKSWAWLSPQERLQLLHYLIQILEIVQAIHEKGYIHRDITPVNFLIDRKEHIWAIDLELAWCSNCNKPSPPFQGGTTGHMSPEQSLNLLPTAKEDIYGIGAMMVWAFTNLPPVKFDAMSPALPEMLFFFTEDLSLSTLVTQCLSENPSDRPVLGAIQRALAKNRDKILEELKPLFYPKRIRITSDNNLNKIIQGALKGLAYSPMLSADQLWISKTQRQETFIANEQLEISHYEGLHTGIAGILYLIGRSKRAGFDIDNCRQAYYRGWEYIFDHYFKNDSTSPAGLYRGGAGIALAMAEGFKSDLISPDEDTPKQIAACFSVPSASYELVSGWAGQGLAILFCSDWMESGQATELLDHCVAILLNSQRADGSWPLSPYQGKKGDIVTGLDWGVSGVVWFLLHVMRTKPNGQVKTTIVNGLNWLNKQRNHKSKGFSWTLTSKGRAMDKYGCSKGIPGIVLSFIKAYEILEDPLYRKIAEEVLENIPARPISCDFTLGNGLAGIGQVYLEAARVFKNPVWRERADWIAEVLIHSFKTTGDDRGYWNVDETSTVTGDLFDGNGGVIDFLIRYYLTGNSNHPLSPY